MCVKLRSRLDRNNGSSLITSPCTGGQGVCVCVCEASEGGKGGSGGGGKRGRSPTHTRPVPPRPPGVSLVGWSAVYLCDWSGCGIYTQRGSVKSGHKFPNFEAGQTDAETVSRSDGGTNRCTTRSKHQEEERRERRTQRGSSSREYLHHSSFVFLPSRPSSHLHALLWDLCSKSFRLLHWFVPSETF